MAAPASLMRRLLSFLPALALLVLLLAALYLAGDAAEGAVRLQQIYAEVFIASALALLVLAVVIAQRLLKLIRQVRQGTPGARLTRRLLLMLVLLVVPPLVVTYGFALRFLHASIDGWFNVSIEQALDDGLGLGRLYLDERLREAEQRLQPVVEALAAEPASAWQGTLNQAADRTPGAQWLVFAGDGSVQALASADPALFLPALPDESVRLTLRGRSAYSAAEPVAERLMLRVVRGFTVPGGETRYAQLLAALPPRTEPMLRRLEGAVHDHGRLTFLRESLKLTFTLILSFVLLLSLLLAVLAAFGVARRLVAPIGRLAEATERVAAGDYGKALPVSGTDELAFLARSFNRMTGELDAAATRVSESQAQTEAQRLYLTTLLQSLSSGVLGLDPQGRLRTINLAASQILGVDLSPWLEQPVAALGQSLPQLEPLARMLDRRRIEGALEWRQEVLLDRGDERQVLMLRGARLPGDDEGLVAVFDDLTVLNRAQREAAWAEVARRLAHEVKNPLTPIQLAAERLRRRFLDRLDAEDASLLDRSTRTIVAQVDALKAMVNAFSDYARPPPLKLEPVDLNALVEDVLDLYQSEGRVRVRRELDSGLEPLRGDPVRLRQVLHNLLKNAIEACQGQSLADILVSTTRVEARGREWVELSVADNGPGLPAGFSAEWFEPYRSSKARGTGLGLAVVKKIAEEHGGQLEAMTRTEGGARFVLRVPGG
jgi:nitrogen fixation/metabolism regulation signal transduction histidine kinase